MQTPDILARVSAVLSIMAALWNGLVAILYFALLLWFLVGFLWLVPLALAVFEGFAALAILILGFKKPNPVVPLVGLFVSLCCFNVFAGMLELLSLGLQIGATVSASGAETEEQDDRTEEITGPNPHVRPVYLDPDDVELIPIPA